MMKNIRFDKLLRSHLNIIIETYVVSGFNTTCVAKGTVYANCPYRRNTLWITSSFILRYSTYTYLYTCQNQYLETFFQLHLQSIDVSINHDYVQYINCLDLIRER